MSSPFQNIKSVNGHYLKQYSNGGPGHMPIYTDDSISTDAVAARVMQYPSLVNKTYYENKVTSDNYLYQRNRAMTAAGTFAALQSRGITLVAQDDYGKLSALNAYPDPSAALASADTQTTQLLSVIVVIGIICLITNSLGSPL